VSVGLPRVIVTDELCNYGAAKREAPPTAAPVEPLSDGCHHGAGPPQRRLCKSALLQSVRLDAAQILRHQKV